jgi:hypothetical protein
MCNSLSGTILKEDFTEMNKMEYGKKTASTTMTGRFAGEGVVIKYSHLKNKSCM